MTVIDYYSRYLLAAHLTYSYSAREVIKALDSARAEAERLCGKLSKSPFLVTDNSPSFIAQRFGDYLKDLFRHVRIQYRTPTQLGLQERFHKTLREEEIYRRMYDHSEHCRQCLAEFRDRYNTMRPLYMKQGKYDKALSTLKEARRINPRLTFVAEGVGLAYYRLGHLDSAASIADTLFMGDKHSPGGHLLRMVIAITQGDINTARYHFQEYLRYGSHRSDYDNIREYYNYLVQ